MAKKRIANVNVRVGVDLRPLERGLKVAQTKLKRFGSSMKSIGGGITRNFTMPFALAGGAGIKLATDLSSSFAKIENLVGITGQTLQDFKQGVLDVSRATGQTQADLADALFVITSAGIRGAEAIDVLTMSAKASEIGLGETKEVARGLTGVLQAYAKDGLTAASATDILTSIVREGNLEASDLAPTLGRIVGIASQLGISFEELGANIATFTRLGVPTEEAVVGLRGVMTTFLQPTTEAAQILDQFGYTAADLRKKLGTQGLQATLAELLTAFEGNDDALASVFGNVRALSNVLGTAGAQGEAYADILNNIQNSTGIVDKGFENVSQTAEKKFKKALNELINAGIALGNALMPVAINIAAFIEKMVHGFMALDSNTKTMLVTLGLLVAAAGPIATAIGVVAGALAVLVSPVGLVVAGIAGVIAAIMYFKESASKIIAGVGNAFIWLYNKIVGFGNSVRKVFSYTFTQFIPNLFKTLLKVVTTTFGAIGRAISLAFSGQFEAAGGVIVSQFEQMQKDLGELGEDAGADYADAWATGFKDVKQEYIDEKAVQRGLEQMQDFAVQAANKVKNFLGVGAMTPVAGGASAAAPIAAISEAAKEAKIDIDFLNLGLEEFTDNQMKGLEDTVPLLKDYADTWMSMAQTIKYALEDVAATAIMSLGEALVSGKFDTRAFVTMVIESFAGMAEQLGRTAIATGLAVEGIKKALQSLQGPVAIAAGVALLALAGAARASVAKLAEGGGAPALANGGLAYGPTMAMVGDNRGAKVDPEVIAPLSKLKDMIGGGQQVVVTGRIQGSDILLSQERATRQRSRYRGY
jgi:TP901 family phage tail tape measure protein